MKKTFLVALALTLICVFALFSCNSKETQDDTDGNNTEASQNVTEEVTSSTDKTNKTDKESCKHSFGAWKTQRAATCKDEGILSRTCSKCKKTERKSAPKLNVHYYRVLDNAVPATCQSTGLTEGVHCEFCNTVTQKQEIIPMLEHTVVTDKAVAPTCKADGLTEGSHCSVCRTVLVEREVVPKLEHTVVVDKAVAATCESSGLTKGSHCSVCKTVFTVQERVELLPHDYGDNELCKDCNAPKSSYGLDYSLLGDNYWLSGIGTCTDTEIIIPEIYDNKKVVTIAANAFKGCSNIISIKMPDTVKSIGTSAFEGCTSLEKIIMSPKITELNSYVFKDCINLTEIDLSSISVFKNNCLTGSYIKALTVSDGATIVMNAFRDSNLESVYIGKNVSEIPSNAFLECEKLSEVVISEGVTTIGNASFRQAPIKSITFPSTLKKIGEDAFVGCKLLETVDFSGANVSTSISSFANCSNLSLIKNWTNIVTKNMFDYSLFEGVSKVDGMFIGCGWLLSGDITLNGKIVVPDGVEIINNQAFLDCSQITEIELPPSLRTVGVSAFSNCSALERICFPEGVTDIGAGAFLDCNALTYVYFPDTMTELESLKINSKRPVTISIGDSITTFNTECITNVKGEQIIEFRGTKAEWQEYNKALNSNIFSYSTVKCLDGDIIQVVYSGNIGSNVTYELLSDGTFNLIGEGELAYKELRISGFASRIIKVVIGEGITKINKSFYSNSTFFGCNNIEEVVFPSTLTTIDKTTFKGSVWYENFNAGSEVVYNGNALLMVPASISGTFTVKDGTVKISECAFFNCTEITEIKLPTSVTVIESSAFSGCRKLEKMILHEGIEKIGNGAFSYTAFTELVIPSTVTEIKNIASSCPNLKKIVIRDASQRIIKGIVAYCDALETVIIEKGVTSLPINTLNSCDSLKYVVLSEDITTVDYQAFLYVPGDVKFLCYSEQTASALRKDYVEYTYMYSENEPTVEGNFWTFDDDGNIVIY